jgi:hypothetical protein
VKLDGEAQSIESAPVFANDDILQVGKRRYLKLKVS